MNLNEISDFLKALRKSKGYTQGELADMLNVSNKTVSKWETGQGIPEMQTLVMLADIYGVTVDEILKGTLKEAKMEEKVNKRFEYITLKAKNGYSNSYIINLLIVVISIFMIFLMNSIFENKTISMIVSLMITITAIILQILNINRTKYQLIELNEDSMHQIKKYVYKTNIFFILIASFAIILAFNYNISIHFVPIFKYILLIIVSSFILSIFITIIFSFFLDSLLKIKIIRKKYTNLFKAIYLLIISFSLIFVSIVGARNLEIKLGMHGAYSYGNKLRPDSINEYYKIKFYYLRKYEHIGFDYTYDQESRQYYAEYTFDDGYQITIRESNLDYYQRQYYKIIVTDAESYGYFYGQEDERIITLKVYTAIVLPLVTLNSVVFYFVSKKSLTN